MEINHSCFIQRQNKRYDNNRYMHIYTPEYLVNFFLILTLTPLLIYAPCEWCVFVFGFVGLFFVSLSLIFDFRE